MRNVARTSRIDKAIQQLEKKEIDLIHFIAPVPHTGYVLYTIKPESAWMLPSGAIRTDPEINVVVRDRDTNEIRHFVDEKMAIKYSEEHNAQIIWNRAEKTEGPLLSTDPFSDTGFTSDESEDIADLADCEFLAFIELLTHKKPSDIHKRILLNILHKDG